MPYRLAAIDLDGTLIASDGKVSEANAGALHHLASRGIVVAAATARPYFAAIRPFEAANVGAAAIACAGADVRLQGGTVVDQSAMPHDFAAFIAGLCDRAGWPATLTTRERTYRRENEMPAWAGSRADIVATTRLADAGLDGVLAVLANVPVGAAFLGELEAWEGRVSMHRATLFNGESLLTITALGIDKGHGLRALCGALGVTPGEAVAFGDSDVDVPMFEVAGMAVAMGSAPDRVKAAAGMVAPTADESGFAAAVHRLWP